MKLADLRKLTIRKQLRISFRLNNGMECVVNEHGLAQVPSLQKVADFNLEQELASAGEFVVEPVQALPSKKSPPARQTLGREQLAAMTSAGAGAAAAEHDDE